MRAGPHFWRRSRFSLAALLTTVVVTVLLSLLAVNFRGGEKKIERQVARVYSIEDPRFAHELGVLLGPQFLPGNRTQVLLNGDAIFPPMLAAIQSAQSTITLETYIYWAGDIGRAFADALGAKA
ncbi:MAG: cardiolipin synthase, partial [Rhodoferax sp.]|nr:cardiolipin synthase [Rhodoferax sp.]